MTESRPGRARPRAVVAVSTLIVAFALAVFSPPVLAADGRCNATAGYQVWEDVGLSGRTTIFCANSIYNLSNEGDGLGWLQSWNDRISSFQTFNMSSTRRTCFWFDAGYKGGSYGVTGNSTVLNVGSYYNDKFSSVRTPDTSGC